MDLKELFDLSGKVAVVTGGAGGIGAVYAEALGDAGASVVIADLNVDAAKRTVNSLSDRGYTATATHVDVSSAESAAEMAAAAIDAYEGIDS